MKKHFQFRLLCIAAFSFCATYCAFGDTQMQNAVGNSPAKIDSQTEAKSNANASVKNVGKTGKKDEAKLLCKLFISQQNSNQDWWYKIPRNSAPQVGQTHKLVMGQDFSLFPFAENAAIKDGKFRLTYSIYLISPDNTRTVMVDSAVFSGKKDLVATVQACPDVMMGTITSPKFSEGKYRFKMLLHDDISGESAETETWFDVVKWSEPAPMKDAKIINAFVKNYYLQPSPETLWAIFFSDELNLGQKSAPNGLNYILVGFLRAAFSQNTFLISKLPEKFASARPIDRAKIIFLTAILNEAEIPSKKLREYEREYQTAIRKAIPKDPHKSWDAVMGAAQLDMLWGEFFADGTYSPIRRIIDALSYTKEDAAAEKMIKEKRKPISPLEWDNMFFGMLHRAALMTLAQNSYDIDLVRGYCEYALKNGDVPKAAVSEITPIVNEEFETEDAK